MKAHSPFSSTFAHLSTCYLFSISFAHSLSKHCCFSRYSMFWVLLLATKLVVSFYVEVLFVTDFINILLDMASEYISAFLEWNM
jgi:hypothetical protein